MHFYPQALGLDDTIPSYEFILYTLGDFKQIDEHFIPDTIARKEDIPTVNLNDYALKSEIPSVAGLASENYVNIKFDELFQNVSNGKELIAGAITDKGVYASDDETFQELSDKIGQIIVGPPGTNIIGYVDEENDIYVSQSELENGTYTLKFEDNVGLLDDFYDIGTVEVK